MSKATHIKNEKVQQRSYSGYFCMGLLTLAMLVSGGLKATGLSGTFTVGTGGNYATLTAAFSALNFHGVTGPVNLVLTNTTYNTGETFPLTLNQVPGINASRRITIRPASNTNVIISGSTATGTALIRLNGADFVTIDGSNTRGGTSRNLTIINNSTLTNTAAIWVSSLGTNAGAINDSIKNLNIMAGSNSVTSTFGIYAAGTAITTTGIGAHNNGLVIENNNISRAYFAIYARGVASTGLLSDLVIERNTIGSATPADFVTFKGVDIQNTSSAQIRNNTIFNLKLSTSVNNAAIDLGQNNTNAVISANVITGIHSTSATGYGAYGINIAIATGNSNITIVNNMISDIITANYSASSTTWNAFGIRILGGTDHKIYHNSVHLSGAPTTGSNGTMSAALVITAGTGMDIRNNIFSNVMRGISGAKSYAVHLPATNAFAIMNQNAYWVGGPYGVFGRRGTMDITNLAGWRGATTQDDRSVHVNSPFISDNNLYLDQSRPAPSGKSVGVNTDIDGDLRCQLFPTLGANESMMGKTNFTGNFFGPDTVFSGTPTVFLNSAREGEPKVYRWYINGAKVSGRAGDSLHLYTTALSGTSATVTLVTVGCAKTDSISKTVVITRPTARPVVDLLGTSYLIRKGETVKFTDLSTNGPNSWKWNISPNTINKGGVKEPRYRYVYGSDSTPINEVRFDVAGKYTVCLTSYNDLGAGLTECRQNYVEVLEEMNMCDVAVTRLERGYLYDDGGPFGNYAPNNKCSLLIAPCADTIYFVLRNFAAYNFDYLRIYDGNSNKGKILHTRCTNLGYSGGPAYPNPSCRPAAGGDTLMAVSGSMFIEWDATYQWTTNQPGFEAYWYSIPKNNVPKPVARFDAPDSVCVNSTIALRNTSQGSFLSYLWDLDGDLSTLEDDVQHSEISFFSTGKRKVTLIAQSCAGTDTFTKEITIYNPTTPQVNFTADNLNPTTADIVFFQNTTIQCADSVFWDVIGPGTVKYEGGTDRRSLNPQMTFPVTGCYGVSLTVYNASAAGSGITYRNCYINVKNPYCVPGVATLVPDVGISRVRFANLNSVSAVADVDYNNFISSRSATVQRGSTYNLTVERTATANTITRNAWIDWNGDGDFDDAGEMLGEERNARTLSWTIAVNVPGTAKEGATVLRIATNFGNLSNKVCGQNQFGEYEDYRIYIRPDVSAPVITLNGQDTVYVEQGYAYIDLGATALDNVDGNVTNKITSSFTPRFFKGIEGTYVQTYSVRDMAGNLGTKDRIVIVVPDRIAPFLTVNSISDTIRIKAGTAFTEPAATAIDSVDGIMNSRIVRSYNPVLDVNVVGTYILTYSVTDDALNTTSRRLFIVVYDNEAPVITMNGPDTMYHEVGTAFTDQGATVADNNDPNVAIQVKSNVNPDVVGTYTIAYNATDRNGNKAIQKSRVVIVRDTQLPVISLRGDSVINLEVNHVFTDPGIIATDNYNENIHTKMVRSGSFIAAFPGMRATKTGTYAITYSVTDAAGNMAMVTRTIIVQDKTAPVISLKGFPVLERVCRWSTYTDEGFVVSDNYYKASQLKIEVESSRTDSTQRLGMWSMRYKATDPSGNVGYSDYRIIYVRECATNVIEETTENANIHIFPNPNNGMFTVDVQLPKQESVKINVVNMLGQEVRMISNGMMHTGKFNVDMSAEKAGIYFINITGQHGIITKKVNISK